jgi:hypothetical protein
MKKMLVLLLFLLCFLPLRYMLAQKTKIIEVSSFLTTVMRIQY